MATRRAISAVIGVAVGLGLPLSGCAPEPPLLDMRAGGSVDIAGFVRSVRGAVDPDGAVGRASQDELFAAGQQICWPLADEPGNDEVGLSVGDVVVSDRDDVDVLIRSAQTYLCP